jgi:hypothetical protein
MGLMEYPVHSEQHLLTLSAEHQSVGVVYTDSIEYPIRPEEYLTEYPVRHEEYLPEYSVRLTDMGLIEYPVRHEEHLSEY